MPTVKRLLRLATPRLPWYGLCVVLSALALVLMLLFRPLMEHSVFFLFLAAVAISALYGGLGPGLVATVLSTAACEYFFLPPDYVPLSGPEGILRACYEPGQKSHRNADFTVCLVPWRSTFPAFLSRF